MPYASLDDLIERAGLDEIRDVADRDLDGTPDPAVIEAALIHADNTVNGYARVQYDLPFATVPDLVRTWSVSIARYFLHRQGPPDYIVRDWKEAISALKDVAAGRLQLFAGEDAPPLQPSPDGQIGISGPEPVFTADNLKGWTG